MSTKKNKQVSPPVKKKKCFAWGDLAKIAKGAGISRQFLNDILRGRRNCKPETAEALVISADAEGIVSSSFDWVFPEETSNTAFVDFRKHAKGRPE